MPDGLRGGPASIMKGAPQGSGLFLCVIGRF
jgi:hypothetical protein